MADAYLAPVEPLEEGTAEPRGLSLGEVISALRRRWWLVAGVAGIVLAIGYWRTMHEPRLYSASATVRLQAGQALLPGMQAAAPRLDYRIDPLLSEQVLIKSQQVAERVTAALGLQLGIARPENLRRSVLFGSSVPVVSPSAVPRAYTLRLDANQYALIDGARTYGPVRYGDTLSGAGITLALASRPDVSAREVVLNLAALDRAAAQVRSALDTRVVPSTDLIEISYTGRDPVMVRDVANTVASTYQEFASEGQRASAEQKTQFIFQSLAEQEQSLRQAQDELKNFKEQYQTADITDEAKALFQTIQSFETERRQLETEETVYEALVGKVTAVDTVDSELRRLAGTGVLGKNLAISTKFAQWQNLIQLRQEKLLPGTLLPNSPDLVRLNEAIANSKSDLREATAIYLDGLRQRLATVRTAISDMKAQSERYPPLEAQQARLVANVETAQKMYTDLTSQYQLSRIQQSADGGTVRLIDEAMVPNFAVSPNRKRAFFFALALGLLLGVGLAVLLERMDDSVRSPKELSERFALPVLGMIPAINTRELSDGTAAGISRIVTHADPRSPVAEAYRSLRTNLAFTRAQAGLRSLVLTSPGPADGKSTTVANLAITFAQQGQRTLLIDGDLRRAVLDKTFGVPRTPGLTDVIIGEQTAAEVIHETQVPNLFVMTSGQLPPNPSELLGSGAMREVLRQAQEDFDMVLFDSPPLLAVTDAAVLSAIVDGTILIARMGATHRGALWRARTQLRAVNANVLGGVLNDVRAEVGAYYGGQGYYYYYASHGEDGARPPLRVLDRLKRLTAAR